jgi:hypothetical protein
MHWESNVQWALSPGHVLSSVILFLANKMNSFILALVETLVAKTRAWEESRGLSFMYDGVPLLAMLDEYVMLREEREEDKKRMKVRSTCS